MDPSAPGPAPGGPADPVESLPGVGAARARALHKRGLRSLQDLLSFFPLRHVDGRGVTAPSRLQEGRPATVRGVLGPVRAAPARAHPGLWLIRTRLVADGGDGVDLVWFLRAAGGRRPPYPAGVREGARVRALGSPRRQPRGFELLGPEVEDATASPLHTGRLVPVYPGVPGLSPRLVRGWVWQALQRCGPHLADPLPPGLRAAEELLPLAEALFGYHFPASPAQWEQARRRLAFDELFLVQRRLAQSRRAQAGRTVPAWRSEGPLCRAFRQRLPFRLTPGQERAMAEVARDLAAGRPMQRLVQGDVGSGKTVVGAYAVILAAENGWQAAWLAPTEVLARQHREVLAAWLEPLGLAVELLVAGRPVRERRELLRRIAEGRVPVVVGTHALLQPEVGFARLGLAVVDEQHRFGVRQRETLRERSLGHLLCMSATPLPQSLARVLYGDLEVSILAGRPPGRKPVDTRWIRAERRQEVYRFLRREVARGGRAYVVFPAVEEGEGELPAAQSAWEALRDGPLRGLAVGLVHGRMTPREQEGVLEAFRRGEVQVLVATTVVEVGVDVPSATVMVVEAADRFGLAQLHQLRGRVGRDGRPAYCLLLASPASEPARRRLEAIRRCQDGFRLAELDLELRGPGEVLGLRQAGWPDFQVADPLADGELLERARRAVHALGEAGPDRAGSGRGSLGPSRGEATGVPAGSGAP